MLFSVVLSYLVLCLVLFSVVFSIFSVIFVRVIEQEAPTSISGGSMSQSTTHIMAIMVLTVIVGVVSSFVGLLFYFQYKKKHQ